MAVLQSVLHFSGSVGFDYALLKLISQDESTYLKKYPETQRGCGVVSVLCATEAKKQFYQQTEKEIDAVKSDL